jgi:hypothetical protein
VYAFTWLVERGGWIGKNEPSLSVRLKTIKREERGAGSYLGPGAGGRGEVMISVWE